MQGVDELTIVVDPYLKATHDITIDIKQVVALLQYWNIEEGEIKSMHVTKQGITLEVGE